VYQEALISLYRHYDVFRTTSRMLTVVPKFTRSWHLKISVLKGVKKPMFTAASAFAASGAAFSSAFPDMKKRWQPSLPGKSTGNWLILRAYLEALLSAATKHETMRDLFVFDLTIGHASFDDPPPDMKLEIRDMLSSEITAVRAPKQKPKHQCAMLATGTSAMDAAGLRT